MADSTGLTAGLSRASGQMAAFGAKMSKVGMGMTKYLTLPLVAVGAVSVKMAADFEGSMRLIQTQAGGSAKDVEVLSKAVLKLATQGQHGPKELADSLYHLKSVGMDNAQAMEALKLAEEGASVGGSKLEETTNAIAGAWRTGIQGAQSFKQAMGTLNAIVGAGNLRMEDLNQALGTGILVSAKTFGVSLTSVGAALALFTSQGMPATQSATRLRMAISLMGAPTDKAAKLLQGIGIGATDMARALREGGLVQAVGLLKQHMEGLSKIQQSQLLSGAFGGARTGTAIMALVDGYDTLVAKQKQIIANSGKFGEAVAAEAKTASAKWHHFLAVLSVDAIKIGNVLLPIASKIAEDLGKLAEAFGNLSPGTQSFIVKMGLLVAAAGPAVFAIGKLSLALATLRAAQVTAGAASGASAASAAGAGAATAGVGASMAGLVALVPAAAIAAAIAAALVLGVNAGIKQAQADKTAQLGFWQDFWKTSEAIAKSGGNWFSRITGNDTNSPDQQAAAAAAKASKPIIQTLSVRMDNASYGEFRKLYAAVDAVKALAAKGIVLNLKNLGQQGPGALNALRDAIVSSLHVTQQKATQILEAIAGKKLNFNWAKQVGSELAKTKASVTSQGAAIARSLIDAGNKAGKGLADGLNRGQGPTKAAAAKLKAGATGPVTPVPGVLANLGKKASDSLAKGVGNVGPTKAAAARLAAASKPNMPSGFPLGSMLGAGVASGLESQLGSVQRSASRIAEAAAAGIRITGQVKSPSRVTMALGVQFALGLAHGIKKGQKEAVAAASEMASNVASILESALGIGESITTMGTQGLPTVKLAKKWAAKVGKLVKGLYKAMWRELKSLNLVNRTDKKGQEIPGGPGERFGAVATAFGDVSSIFTAFTEITPESVAKAMAGIAAAKAQAKKIAKAVKAMVKDFRAEFKKLAITEGETSTSSGAAGIAGDVSSILGSFAEMTVEGITKAIVGMNEAARRAPELAAAMVSMVRSLQTALKGVTTGDEFTGLVSSIATIVGDITGAISSLGSMTEKAIQDGIWGAGWVAKKAMELGDALRRMVGWLNLALQGIDTAALAGMQEKLSVLSDIAGKTAAIVSDLASMTPAQLSAAGAAGSGAGLISALAGASGGHSVVNSSVVNNYSVSVPIGNVQAVSKAQAQALASSIANVVITRLGTAKRSTKRGTA
jgi:TP901 family phage tail tape measure protein